MDKSQGYADVRCWKCGKTIRTDRLVDRRFMPRGWMLHEVRTNGFLVMVKLCTKCKAIK
jgi:hypothetical protein